MKKSITDTTILKRWEITGLIATLVIVLIIPFYTLKMRYLKSLSAKQAKAPVASFVGREKCIDCHRKEHDKWRNSHHDKAMDVASDETVLGDFNNTFFSW